MRIDAKKSGTCGLYMKNFFLELPPLITVVILLYIGHYAVAVIFLALILSGQIFKRYILRRVKQAIESIAHLLPQEAFIKKGDDLVKVTVTDVKEGDIVALKSGERASVDGVLIDQHALFDESVTTGESKPVQKHTGDRILAGSININGLTELKAVSTSASSTLSQIQDMVKQAQKETSPLSQFTQKFAACMVLFALVAMVIMYFLSHDILRTLTLWIALVPIVFALIVPVATTLGISTFARKGILIKSGRAIENCTHVTSVVFDKTGTLTKGAPALTDIVSFSSLTKEHLLQQAASLDRYSEHTLSEPIVKEAERQKIPLIEMADIKVLKGKGISGRSSEGTILVGNDRALKEARITIPQEKISFIEEKENEGNSVSYIVVNGTLVGALFLSDTPREEAHDVIQWLKNEGIKIYMVTGDNEKVAHKIAQELAIDNLKALALPKDKVTFIKELQKQHEVVMMVGDGINDAPSLAAAEIGVALGLKGVDITLQSAQVILVDDNLKNIPELFEGSEFILTIMKQDLWLATAVHLVLGFLVAFNYISLLETALLHQVSSIFVILNTFRIKKLKSAP